MTEIKICGITNQEDAALVAECGADAIGFIFYPQSPRYVTPHTARQIVKGLPDDVTTVGVFVNHDAREVTGIVDRCVLELDQFHGAETPLYCCQFPRSQVIKAVAPRTEDDLVKVGEYPVRAILVDAYDPHRYGGTGGSADWAVAAAVRGQHPLILAGGLSMDNIQQAIEHVSPHAVDINSGVELSPGKKDHRKVKAIIDLVHKLGGEDAGIFNR